mmetsp:Transcript_2725/g.3863  ORF Transcript_2725/g.3863 Transcript_2725/m.3863 type:complete len:194 (+) Transcript_2725:165-746(+)
MPSYQNNTKGPCDEETSKLVVQIKQDVEESSSSTKSYLGFGFAALLVVVLLGTAANSGTNRTMKSHSGLSRLGYVSRMEPEFVANFCNSFAEKPSKFDSSIIIEGDEDGDPCTLCYDHAFVGYYSFGYCMLYGGYVSEGVEIPDGVLTVTTLADCALGDQIIRSFNKCIEDNGKYGAQYCLDLYWVDYHMNCE